MVVTCELPLLGERKEKLVSSSERTDVWQSNKWQQRLDWGTMWSRMWWKVWDTRKFLSAVFLICWWRSINLNKEMFPQIWLNRML
jgi:hypothetical protein